MAVIVSIVVSLTSCGNKIDYPSVLGLNTFHTRFRSRKDEGWLLNNDSVIMYIYTLYFPYSLHLITVSDYSTDSTCGFPLFLGFLSFHSVHGA